MPTNYPNAIDDFAFPPASPIGAPLGSQLEGRSHSQWHRDLADAVIALQTRVGIDPLVLAMSGGGTYELGTSLASVALSWTASKPLASQSMTGPGAPALLPGDRAATIPGPITADATWSLSATAAVGGSASASRSVAFRSRRHWGVSTASELDDAAVLALAGSELSTSRLQTRAFDATGGRFLWFAWPADFGAPEFWVGGLLTTAWVEVVRPLVNALGYTRSYRLYRSEIMQTGSAITVEVR